MGNNSIQALRNIAPVMAKCLVFAPRRHIIILSDLWQLHIECEHAFNAATEPLHLGCVFERLTDFEFCHCAVPKPFLDLCYPRGDGYVGISECLAVLLAVHTWRDELPDAPSWYVDNDGVLGSLLKGSSKSPEINLLVATPVREV